MLDFCPLDGKHITADDLAYELVFPDGWSWDRVKIDTVIDTKVRPYIHEKDQRRRNHYRSAGNCAAGATTGTSHYLDYPDTPVMVQEYDPKYGGNGFALLCASLTNSHDEEAGTSYEEMLRRRYGHSSGVQAADLQHGNPASGKTNGPMKLSLKNLNGKHAFVNEQEDPVMFAIPCCPYCHRRLPDGWLEADDFAGISLVGPEGTGKTAYLVSILKRVRSGLIEFPGIGKGRIRIRPGFVQGDKRNLRICRMADDLSQNKGKYMGRALGASEPLFFSVEFDGSPKKHLIIGFYDRTEAELKAMNPLKNPEMSLLLDHMYAEMYFFDPELLGLSDNPHQTHGGIKADASAVAELFGHMQRLKQEYYKTELCRNMRFLGILPKSDLIRSNDALMLNDDFKKLFCETEEEAMSWIKKFNQRNQLAESYLLASGLMPKAMLDQVKQLYGKGISFHSLSAFGCAVGAGGTMTGPYCSLYVEEPLVYCIMKKIEENGWR